jgi:hypothetical protein
MLSAASGVDVALRYALKRQSHCVPNDFTAKERLGGVFGIVIPELSEMECADQSGMSMKILSSGCFKIFVGKGNHQYHK